MMSKKQNSIPESKKKIVKELEKLIQDSKTILVSSIKNIPASQFQEIKKSLRNKAIVKVPKKNLIFRAIDKSENKELNQIKEKIDEQIVILFSDLDSFELAAELIENKTPSKAKPGQEAPEDIQVDEGPTDLIPGPAVSELGALGIQIKIEKGKINIKKSKIIVKKGDKISESAADIMAKLDIKPFEIGFIPLAAFDNNRKVLYLEMKIDKKEAIKNLKESYSKSLPFAVEIGYACSETIGFLLTKANLNAQALEKISKLDTHRETKEETKEESSEEKKDKDTQVNMEEAQK